MAIIIMQCSNPHFLGHHIHCKFCFMPNLHFLSETSASNLSHQQRLNASQFLQKRNKYDLFMAIMVTHLTDI